MRQSPELELCHRLATGSKHFEFDHRRWQQAPKVGDSRVTASARDTMAGFRVLKIVDDTGAGRYALDVYKAALAYWDGFFTRHRLGKP